MTDPSSNSNGRFIVDIRIFMLSMTVAMCASFFAGVVMGPAAGVVVEGSQSTTTTASMLLKQPPPPLDLTKEQIAQSHSQQSPSGQHLLVDISGVQRSFLDDEKRLSDAMTQTVTEAGMQLLSYHCHKLFPEGISCVGVLMEAHITFHTWPEEGVITLDLFSSGSESLLPDLVTTMSKLFGVPRDNNDDEEEVEVRVKWSHELRGFRPDDIKSSTAIDGYSDLSYMILSPLDVYSKEQIYSNLTRFQRVDIWDIVELDDSPSHDDGLKHGLAEGDPRWDTPELSTPARALFLNGYLIRSADSDKETHEALVHPAMFAHPNPERVAIVGGREGGALREILKHKTVTSAVLIEPDEELVAVCRQFFPKLSDCSDLVGRAKDCFEDDIVTVHNEDPKEYFQKQLENSNNAPFLDVIIVDDKDPRHAPELFTDDAYIASLVDSLTTDGVMMINAGMAPDIDDPRADKGVFFVREQLMRRLESHPDVKALLVYEESRTGFNDPTSMLIVCKSTSCRSRWYARSDQIDFAIYERIVTTHSTERALEYFDGTTQFSYSIAPKAWETVYCRREPTPFECAYLHLDPKKELHDLFLDDESKSSFRVVSKTEMVATAADSDEEEKTISFVYATVDIPAGSYIMPKHLASTLVVTQRNLEGLSNNLNVGGGPVTIIEDLLQFIDGHSHASNTEGTDVHFVEIGGTTLIRTVDAVEEANIGRWVPAHPSGHNPVYSPVYERHRMSFDVFIVTTKDIPAGTELLRHKSLWRSGN